MSLYSRGTMRSSSQSSNAWRPPPIFQTPPLDHAMNDTARPGSILDGSLFLPPSLPPELNNTGRLEAGIESDDELLAEQHDELGSGEADASMSTMNVATLEPMEEGVGFAMGNNSSECNFTQERQHISKNEESDHDNIETRTADRSAQETDDELERMSPIRADFETIIKAARRNHLPITNLENKLGLRKPEDEERVPNSLGNESEDRRLHLAPNHGDKIYHHRGVPYVINKESLAIKKILNTFQWPEKPDETQAMERGTANSISDHGSFVLVTRSAVTSDEAAAYDEDEDTYPIEKDEEDGGAAIGAVRTLYEELAGIQNKLRGHPVIRDWSPSKFMEEWAREDGSVQQMLELYYWKLL